ncbi:PQ loop repeat-domain-containing protein [Durotheca rogersii]|uniref:PQ loop repeat-domain-containing protein n=1 Tax=Durotheca rogersii TaxID=419775 RepID=UPI00222095B6|nr:PQ loop repeat-domain-containing protein [Durotheca rogersii]KAI5859556.1 PQ loop repeat-domain-containing protein [Durotheca rogersii]
MAPQQNIPLAANVLGWTNWRTKKTDGLPGAMMYLWSICGVPFGVYNIVQGFNYPLQLQPQIFMSLCLVNWCQILFKFVLWKVIAIGLANAVAFAAIETVLIVKLRPQYDAGDGTGVLAIGVVANVLLAAGLLPPYGELWKRKGRVVGINFLFLTMDWLGAFFSLISLVAQNTFDILGGVLYIVCMFLESGIFISHIIWLIRTRNIRNEAAAKGKTFDDVAAEYKKQGIPFKFAEREYVRQKKPKLNGIEMGGGDRKARGITSLGVGSHVEQEDACGQSTPTSSVGVWERPEDFSDTTAKRGRGTSRLGTGLKVEIG